MLAKVKDTDRQDWYILLWYDVNIMMGIVISEMLIVVIC